MARMDLSGIVRSGHAHMCDIGDGRSVDIYIMQEPVVIVLKNRKVCVTGLGDADLSIGDCRRTGFGVGLSVRR